MEVARIDPRRDKVAIIQITREFCEWNKTPFDAKSFEQELDKRIMDLKQRNAIILAKEGEEVVGVGFFTIYKNFMGKDECVFYKVITRQADSFKKGIEEVVIREMMKYAKNTLGIAKFNLTCPDSDSGYRSLLMKLGIKKTTGLLYEKEM